MVFGMPEDSEAMDGADLLSMALGRGLPGAGGADLDEFVEFEVFFDGSLKAAEAGQAVPFLRARLCDAFEVFGAASLDRYLWHCDRLVLELQLGEGIDDEPHLEGHMRTGDGAEDEWFITFLLQRLTAARPDTSCRVVDADGELVLIEAALAMPRWLSPANAENRCWLRGGKVHLLPKPVPPEPDLLSCKQGLARLRAAAGTFVAKDKVQQAINSRVEGYPQKALELSTHVAKVVMPATAARLFLAFPQLVSVALDNLPAPATAEFNRLRKSLTGAEAKVRFDCETVTEKDMVCVGIRFTRCQYARLMGMRNQLPQRFAQKLWKSPPGKAGDEKAMKFGAMICAGLEASFLQGSQSATAALRWPSHKLSDTLLPQMPGWGVDPRFAAHARELPAPLSLASCSVRRAFEQQRDLEEDYRPALIKAMALEAVRCIDLTSHWRDNDDSEDWLQISSEELDQEMERRLKEFEAHDQKRNAAKADQAGAGGRAEAAASEVKPEKLQEELASMGKEISSLLQRASGLEGVEAAPKAAGAGGKAAAPSRDADSDSDSEGSEDVDVLGMEDMPEDESDGEDGDSDGEDGKAAFTEDDMRKYMAEMDEQLEECEGVEESAPEPPKVAGQAEDHGFPLGSHHIKIDDSQPLELDVHAMEHLLASYCSEHHFEPGPASLLLGELGLAGGGGYKGAVSAGGSLDSMD